MTTPRPCIPPHAENPFAGQGTAVLLDIGGDIGALVVEMPKAMVGVEIEVRPVAAAQGSGTHAHHPHVAVVDRQAPVGTVPSLVFGELRAGTYQLCKKGGSPTGLSAVVRGSEVSHLTWPT